MRRGIQALAAIVALQLAISPLCAAAPAALAGLPPFLVKLGAAMDRLSGMEIRLREKPQAKSLQAEFDKIKEGLEGSGNETQVARYEEKLDALQAKLMGALHPGLADLSAEQQQQAWEDFDRQTEMLQMLEEKKANLHGAFSKELDGLEESILSAGLDRTKLDSLFDRVRGVGVAGELVPLSHPPEALRNQARNTSFRFPGSAPLTSRRTSGTYPRPKQVPIYDDAYVPSPYYPGNADEATVVRIARENGMKPGIVQLAFREAQRQGVDYRMVLAVIKTESAFKTNATSGVGARGLMQIMPATGKGLGVKNPNDLYDAATNVHAGVKYLAGLWRQFATTSFYQLNSMNPLARNDVKKAIAAYNAGPGAVKKYGNVPPYRETQGYVVKVLQSYVRYRRMFPNA